MFNVFGGNVNGAVFSVSADSCSLLIYRKAIHFGGLRWVSIAARRLSLVVVCELLVAVASLVEPRFRVCGLQ